MRITNLNISSRHFKIQRYINAIPSRYICIDTSTNGTYVNQQILDIRSKTRDINLYDEISLLNPVKESGAVKYMFIVYEQLNREQQQKGPSNFYTISDLIGCGNFAKVRIVNEKSTGEKYAMKIIEKRRAFDEKISELKLLNEYKVLKDLRHENVICLHDVMLTNDYFYLVFELVDGGDLLQMLNTSGPCGEEQIRGIMTQIFKGIEYLHKRKVIHRDIKLENLLITSNGCVKITDFGMSKIIEHTFVQTLCGTPTYVSPELLLGNGYDEKADIWSAGVVFYTLACGFQPFIGRDEGNRELFDLISNGKYEFVSPYWDNKSLEMKDLISNMLVVNPKNRYDVKQCLTHPFFESRKRNRTGEVDVNYVSKMGTNAMSTTNMF